MIVVYPFSPVDQHLALKNAKWMNELGGCKGHECLMVADGRCDQSVFILEELKKAFDSVYVLPAKAEIDGWPEGANYFFRIATSWMGNANRWPYFLWMEPDSIPLSKGWADAIEADHRRSGKAFTGDRVQVENIPVHMSGIGIYPNPLHAFAGEAYRAHETAWDMAGKDQIVPRANFTKLIEHAWKHPSFTDASELKTQIRPEAVLFHASKDGSLIDILRGNSTQSARQIGEKSAVQVGGPAPNLRGGLSEPQVQAKGDLHINRSADTRNAIDDSSQSLPSQHGLSGREVGATSFPHPQSEVYAGSSPVQPTCDIFIRTYPGDYPWLKHCLRSINTFCSGFRKIWIVSPQDAPFDMKPLGYEWKAMNDECDDGYLAQQITKMYADVITDYQPDNILHVDSDVIFTRPVTPQDFLSVDGKVIWYYTPYHLIETPWKPITEKFMGMDVPFEFMRRFPIMVPRWLYPRIREFCHKTHGRTLSEYIRNQPLRAFSEFNVMGAYAYGYHHDKVEWVDTRQEGGIPSPVARQFHSWGGITPEVEKELSGIFSDRVVDSPSLTAGAGTASGERRSPLTPPGIKELPNGLWVLENDTHISKWIEQQERLDHDQNALPDILPLINEGDIVVDAGAFVGDHTIAYLNKVGSTGTVYAFEPNPLAMECLKHNLTHPGAVQHTYGLCTYQAALGEKFHPGLPLSGNNGNAGGSYLGEHMAVATVPMMALDDLDLEPDFIKFDVEGCEVKALIGAQKTIRKHRPVMVIEVNTVALERQGNTVGQLYALLESHDYEWTIMQENCCESDPMFDIIAKPKTLTKSPEVSNPDNGSGGLTRCPNTPPPVSPPLIYDMLSAVTFLKAWAEVDTNHRMRVMQNLSKAGLTPRWPKRKKKSHEKVPVQKDNRPTEIPTGGQQDGAGKPVGKRRASKPKLVHSKKPEAGKDSA